MNVVISPFSAGVQNPLKKVKASGGCHGIGKEFFVQAQSRFQTQLRQGIID
ncbi:hypothetical protein ABNX05_04715 [Lysinibacillus sp. M3]|uniref:Uncharacterized protein n=1 Tax=Lysinibacillus zambalensis TaxID=3160866 RepID=A0ABV1MQK9_9BACI